MNNAFDATEITLKILSCIYRSAEKYGASLISSSLCGRRNKQVEKFGLDKLSTFGIVSDYSASQVRAIIYEIMRLGLIYRSTEHKNLKITDKGKEFIKQKLNLSLPNKILEDAKTPLFCQKLQITHIATLTLWQKGLKIPQIANKRRFKETTIEEHLADLVFHYKINGISAIVSKDKEALIKSVLNGNQKNFRLKPIKEKLPPDVTYGQIRTVMALLQRSGKY